MSTHSTSVSASAAIDGSQERPMSDITCGGSEVDVPPKPEAVCSYLPRSRSEPCSAFTFESHLPPPPPYKTRSRADRNFQWRCNKSIFGKLPAGGRLTAETRTEVIELGVESEDLLQAGLRSVGATDLHDFLARVDPAELGASKKRKKKTTKTKDGEESYDQNESDRPSRKRKMESKREERATNVELPPHHPRRGEDLTISGKQPWQVLQEPCARYDLRPSAEFVNQDGLFGCIFTLELPALPPPSEQNRRSGRLFHRGKILQHKTFPIFSRKAEAKAAVAKMAISQGLMDDIDEWIEAYGAYRAEERRRQERKKKGKGREVHSEAGTMMAMSTDSASGRGERGMRNSNGNGVVGNGTGQEALGIQRLPRYERWPSVLEALSSQGAFTTNYAGKRKKCAFEILHGRSYASQLYELAQRAGLAAPIFWAENRWNANVFGPPEYFVSVTLSWDRFSLETPFAVAQRGHEVLSRAVLERVLSLSIELESDGR